MPLGPFVVIEVPFHMGLENVAVGGAPRRLLEAGADRVLAHRGRPAQVEHIRLRDAECKDLDAVVDVNRQIRIAVRQAIEQEMTPVVLAGNCNSCLGTLAGLEPALTGIVWFDAHPDFHTPRTTISGLLEGMSLAIAVGHCHEELRARIGFSRPVLPAQISLIGTRDIDPGEDHRLIRSGISEQLPRDVDAVYVHLDLDFLDPAAAPGVNFRGPGGMALEEACRRLREVVETLPVAAVNLTNYRPDLDTEDRTVRSALKLLEQLTAAR